MFLPHIKRVVTCTGAIIGLLLFQVSDFLPLPPLQHDMLSRPFRTLLGVAVLALAVGSAAGSVITPRVVHERRATTPRGWSLQRRADPDRTIPLSFALAESNVHNLEAYLLDIADPASPNYGKHWTPARVAETFRPSSDAVDTVREWLTGEGGVDPARIRLSKDGGYLDLHVTVAEAESMLGTEYYEYEHKDGTRHIACKDSYHLPEHVAKHVDTVWPTVHFDVVPLSRRSDVETVPGRSLAQGARSPMGLLKTEVSNSRTYVFLSFYRLLILA